ncbi:hypothetical protein C8J56DRAFT_954501 [Mycena floridula]|nr:hypothetical protein C8J56DRAFT_954501 [Mycena floridula]
MLLTFRFCSVVIIPHSFFCFTLIEVDPLLMSTNFNHLLRYAPNSCDSAETNLPELPTESDEYREPARRYYNHYNPHIFQQPEYAPQASSYGRSDFYQAPPLNYGVMNPLAEPFEARQGQAYSELSLYQTNATYYPDSASYYSSPSTAAESSFPNTPGSRDIPLPDDSPVAGPSSFIGQSLRRGSQGRLRNDSSHSLMPSSVRTHSSLEPRRYSLSQVPPPTSSLDSVRPSPGFSFRSTEMASPAVATAEISPTMGQTLKRKRGAGVETGIKIRYFDPSTTTTKKSHRRACEVCRKRKVKCAKQGNSCLQCIKSGVPCIAYTRPKPRPKS